MSRNALNKTLVFYALRRQIREGRTFFCLNGNAFFFTIPIVFTNVEVNDHSKGVMNFYDRWLNEHRTLTERFFNKKLLIKKYLNFKIKKNYNKKNQIAFN